jgi:hypothetical protein
MAVPWAAFAAGNPPAAKPASGDVWAMNLFVLDARESGQRAAGWSAPRVGDFHALDRFGRVVFVDPNAPTAAAPAQPAAPAGEAAPPQPAAQAAAPTGPVQVNPAIAAQLRARLGKTAFPAALPANGPPRR